MKIKWVKGFRIKDYMRKESKYEEDTRWLY